MKKNDLTGRQFGHLQVIKQGSTYVSPKGYQKIMWLCECDCGNVCEVMGSHLLSGHSTSCGCRKTAKLKPKVAADLTGQRYGMLTVMHRMPNRQVGKNSRVVWHCRCDCGNETDVLALLLFEGLVKSCGCRLVSHAERIMAEYLTHKGVVFEAQYMFDGLHGIGGGNLKFDFAVFTGSELSCLIELDGVQHNRPVDHFGGMPKYEQLKANDALKDEWASLRGLKLIRVDVSECCSDSDFINLYDEVFASYHVLD